MQKEIKRFVSDKEDTLGKSEWFNENEENPVYSGAIEVNDFHLDMDTLFVVEERKIAWIKAKSQKMLDFMINTQIGAIKKGTVALYREFSTAPYFEDQQPDMNPTTEETITDEDGNDRYSQIKMCLAKDFDAKHRVYVVAENPEVLSPAEKLARKETQLLGAQPTSVTGDPVAEGVDGDASSISEQE